MRGQVRTIERLREKRDDDEEPHEGGWEMVLGPPENGGPLGVRGGAHTLITYVGRLFSAVDCKLPKHSRATSAPGRASAIRVASTAFY